MKHLLPILILFILSCNTQLGDFEIAESDQRQTDTLIVEKLSDSLDQELAIARKVLRNQIVKMGGLDEFILPDSDNLERIPQHHVNPLSPEKVELGRRLFSDTNLAIDPMTPIGKGTYSCETCHRFTHGTQSGLPQGIGEGAILTDDGNIKILDSIPKSLRDAQKFATPTLVDIAFNPMRGVLWDASLGDPKSDKHEINELDYDGEESQAVKGFEVHRSKSDFEYFEKNGYRSLFINAFYPNYSAKEFIQLKELGELEPQHLYDQFNIGFAIAAYERTIISNRSKWQKSLRWEYDLTLSETKAMSTFLKSDCTTCHLPPNFAGFMHKPFGTNKIDSTETLDLAKTAGLTAAILDSCFGFGSGFVNIDDLLIEKGVIDELEREEIKEALHVITDYELERYKFGSEFK